MMLLRRKSCKLCFVRNSSGQSGFFFICALLSAEAVVEMTTIEVEAFIVDKVHLTAH